MTELEILKAARELISVPERFTTGTSARDKLGNEVHPKSEDASCWCAIGAVDSFGGSSAYSLASVHTATARHCLDNVARSIDDVVRGIKGSDLRPASWLSDNLGHAATLAMFDAAIAKLEAP